MNERYGQWMVLKDAGRTSRGLRLVEARCDCGSVRIVRLSHLQKGLSTSCHGAGKARLRHGHTAGPASQTNRRTAEHTAWSSMKARCGNEKHPNYPNYGGRGITVCDRWRNSFEAFLADMGLRPSPQHSIDRVNNDGPYTPDNCRWTTDDIQRQNRRSSADNCRWTTDDIQRQNRRSSGPSANASPEQIAEIHRRVKAGERPMAIARAVGVSKTTLAGIRRRLADKP